MERWKTLDFLGLPHYSISSDGQVKNIKHNKLVKIGTPHGYAQVSLYHKGKPHYWRVHRLVALAFLANPHNYSIVSHINDDKNNNCVDNLEWATVQGNSQRAIENGKRPQGIQHCRAKLIPEEITWIKDHYVARDRQFGAGALSVQFKVSRSTILKLIHNVSYQDII